MPGQPVAAFQIEGRPRDCEAAIGARAQQRSDPIPLQRKLLLDGKRIGLGLNLLPVAETTPFGIAAAAHFLAADARRPGRAEPSPGLLGIYGGPEPIRDTLCGTARPCTVRSPRRRFGAPTVRCPAPS